MFKKFPSYFSIISAIIFIFAGLFIGLAPYTILVGVVIVIFAAFILAFIIRIYLESIFPEPVKPQEEEEDNTPLTDGPEDSEEAAMSYSKPGHQDEPGFFETEASDRPVDFADFDSIRKPGDDFSNEDNIDENEE